MTRFLHFVVFAVGLAAVVWIGTGYVASNPLALAVTILIGVVYLTGAIELFRYQQASATLTAALARLGELPADLGTWLQQAPPSLRHTVRLRIEGERVGLPGPVLAPYLVGLLVLLGMLGTFLGMVATLRGTGLALESSTDLAAMRASLAAPVKGLGFAFGTSVAGVATSAMLGLLAALCRRERIKAAQMLDATIATTLRTFSLAHQREESFKLLQRQSDIMPTVVDRLQAMMTAITQQNEAMNARLLASQDAFHAKTETTYDNLATSVGQSLRDSVAEGARTASAAIEPAVQATMAGLTRETTALHDTVTQAVQQQLDGLSARFEISTTTVADIWKEALAGQQRASESLTQDLQGSLERFAATFEQRADRLLQGVSTRLDGASSDMSQAWQDAMARQEQASTKSAGAHQLALTAAAAAFADHSAALVRTVGKTHEDLRTALAAQDAQRLATWTALLGTMAATLREESSETSTATANRLQAMGEALAQTAREMATDTRTHTSATLAEIERLVHVVAAAPEAAAAVQAEQAAHDQQRLTAWTASLATMAASLRETAEQTQTDTARRLQAMCDTLAQTARDISSDTRTQASHTLIEIDKLVQVAAAAPKAAADLHTALAAQDQQRLAAWTASLAAMAASLREQFQQTGTESASRQQAICDALADTARVISAETQAHASSTIAEIARLVHAASEAPKAAADVVIEVRQKLSDSMARDNVMLEERSRMLDTLGTLLDALNHASTEQREAVDALVSTSADVLNRVGGQFLDRVEAETGKLTDVAAHVTGSAIEVASLGEAFGTAVQQFSQSNESLVGNLQRIEAALDKSTTRSDEQLAYYVAQAREVIDLSMMAQKQIVEDLQQLADARAPTVAIASAAPVAPVAAAAAAAAAEPAPRAAEPASDAADVPAAPDAT